MAESFTPDETIKREMLQAFGEAYRGLGLNKQMGYIVALLLMSPEPLSLDEITKSLGMSKGPISQITRRLQERNIIRKVWSPGSRKDYYEIQPDIFASAFKNFAEKMHTNTMISQMIRKQIDSSGASVPEVFDRRLNEMEHFYALMDKHFTNFLDEWAEERTKIASPTV